MEIWLPPSTTAKQLEVPKSPDSAARASDPGRGRRRLRPGGAAGRDGAPPTRPTRSNSMQQAAITATRSGLSAGPCKRASVTNGR